MLLFAFNNECMRLSTVQLVRTGSTQRYAKVTWKTSTLVLSSAFSSLTFCILGVNDES